MKGETFVRITFQYMFLDLKENFIIILYNYIFYDKIKNRHTILINLLSKLIAKL
jgi:hypothetical protein